MTTHTEMTEHFKALIEITGENVTREGLLKTPERAAKTFHFLTSGYHQDLNTIVNDALFTTQFNNMVIIRDIEFYSLCEHHLLPFFGKCHIAYVPHGNVLGLSKFARIVDHFSRRLQVQEELTDQIAKYILEVTGAKGVGVIIEAKHLCMMMRGVKKQHSDMRTSAMLGLFRDNAATRNEFLQLLK